MRMATLHFSAVVALILVLQSHADPPSYNFPIFDPCEVAGVCGKGYCVHVTNNTIGFECECEDGWRQARPQEEDFLKFLPCVIPNCTVNFLCTDASRPRNDYPIPTNTSDPCSRGECGGGRCNATSSFTRTCLCDDGYYNLLNSTNFPCYRSCAFGQDCSSLGFNTSTTVIDPNPLNRFNQATSLIARAELACLITMAASFIWSLWNYK